MITWKHNGRLPSIKFQIISCLTNHQNFFLRYKLSVSEFRFLKFLEPLENMQPRRADLETILALSGDTLLVCANGHLTDNKLAVGLLFPSLLTSDIFALPIENVLLVPDYTMEEIGRWELKYIALIVVYSLLICFSYQPPLFLPYISCCFHIFTFHSWKCHLAFHPLCKTCFKAKLFPCPVPAKLLNTYVYSWIYLYQNLNYNFNKFPPLFH